MKHRTLHKNKLRGSYNNILKLDLSDVSLKSGEVWYPLAHYEADKLGIRMGYSGDLAIRQGAGVIAALSPLVHWDTNLKNAHRLINTRAQVHTHTQQNKALAIWNGANPIDELGKQAFKTIAFYMAIYQPNNDHSEVVVDRHATFIYCGKQPSDKHIKFLASKPVYNKISNAYIKAADYLGLNRHVTQAATWVQHRINKGIV